MFKGKRILGLYFFFLLAFIALIGRLCYIQLFNGPFYAKYAVAQRQHTLDYVQYPRGQILDRNLRPLTNKEQQPCAVIFPVMVKDYTKTAAVLSNIICLPQETVIAKLGGEKNNLSNIVKKPFILKSNLNNREIKDIQNAKLPGVFVLPMIPRYRPDTLAVHTIGYVAPINYEEYVQLKERNAYQLTDVVGKNGLEKKYETLLKGGVSKQVAALIDDRGRLIQGKGFTLLSPGRNAKQESHNIVVTIDADYQQIVEQELKGHSGAAVVMDVANGDILALASSPKFDPSMLQKPTGKDVFVNKALQNYPPASVFKLVLAAGALEEGLVQPQDLFSCNGYITIPTGRNVSCWKPDGHGEISFAEAMANSCNPVFIETGLKLGGELIKNYANKFGLNQDYIIGYSTKEIKHINFNSQVPGDVANASIGEKGISLSPVSVAKLICEVANGGISVTPRLVSQIQDTKGHTEKEFAHPATVRIISSKTAKEIKMMLKAAVEEGTGKPAQIPEFDVAGKTGSSQTHGVWFAGFAPVEQPQWAVVVFIQKGSSGGHDAAPIFKNIVSRLAAFEGISSTP